MIIDRLAAHKRKRDAYFVRLAAKINGSEERRAAAADKRQRKAEKRVRDAERSAIGQLADRRGVVQ